MDSWTGKPREIFYFRQRFKNRVFNRLAEFFAQEAAERGVTKKTIAERLGKDPAQITRWLSGPGNLTMDTLSDLLFAMGAEPEPPQIVRFAERPAPNYMDPLIAKIMGESMPVRKNLGIEFQDSFDSNSNPVKLA